MRKSQQLYHTLQASFQLLHSETIGIEKMLRRNSSNRLSRRKSASSVHSKHESIDPKVARQHAHAAATLAFARAQERHSTDMGQRGGGPSRSNTNSSYQDQQPLSQQSAAGNANGGIKRQHSVRFVGPNGVQRRRSINSRATDYPVRPKPSTATLRPMAITTNAPVPAAYRPPSRSSSLGRASAGKGTAESFVTALAAYNEYYTREDDVASTPSSYRRIRKSKSMFSPLKAPNCFYTNGTPERPNSEYRCGKPSVTNSLNNQVDAPAVPLRAPKSTSHLRGGREDLTSGVRDRNDEAVQMARDRFFHQTAQQRLREQPSFLFRSKAQRQEKPFRKSVRSSSTNSHDIPVASSNQTNSLTEPGLKEKARRASQNIRSRLRRVFGRNKEEPVLVPNQQVDARETHVRQYPGDLDSRHNSFNNIPHPNHATLSRVASRPPSLHAATSSQQLRSHAGSVRSTRSGHSDDKSRVTSWNSTGVNTVTSQAARLQAERELQRLSIINENGTHVTSSSFNRQKLANQFSSYPVVHRPSKSAGPVPAPGSGLVDSARVYSALMKRLDENSPKAKIEALRKASVESFAPPKQIPPRSSSAHSSRGNRTPATIRQVLTESSNGSKDCDSAKQAHQWVEADCLHSARAEDAFGYTGTHVHQWVTADPLREARMRDQDDVFSPKHSNDNKEKLSSNLQRGRSGSNSSTRELSIRTSYHTAPENFGLTPQEVGYRNEPIVQGTRCLREARATFFGGTRFTIARTTSPFRRAVVESDHNSVFTTEDIPISVNNLPLRKSLYIAPGSVVLAENGIQECGEHDKAYSPSLYSRTTSGQTPAAANSALSLPMPENVPEMRFPDTSPGDVVILDRATYRPSMPGDKGHRATSSASSTDWKKWMSSEVAKLERAKDNTNTSASYVNYALPTMPKSVHNRHVRENAQIIDDDTDILQRKSSVVQKPFGILQQNTTIQNVHQIGHQSTPLLKPILKNNPAVSQAENRDSTTTNTHSIPVPPPPPPIPVRSPLRVMQSKSSLRSVNTVNTFNTACTQSAPNSAAKISSMSGRNLLHKRNASQNTLRSATSAESPAKLVKRHGRKAPYTTNPSPASSLGVAVELQFGSASTRSRIPGAPWRGDKENDNPQQIDELYGAEGAGLMGPSCGGARQVDAEQMGSKRMVDLFLSSRRRRIAGLSEESNGVFL